MSFFSGRNEDIGLTLMKLRILILRPETGERTETKFMQIHQVLVFFLSMNKRHNFHQILISKYKGISHIIQDSTQHCPVQINFLN